MSRLAGSRFVELARRIERRSPTWRFVVRLAVLPPHVAVTVLLDLADGEIRYRLGYDLGAPRAPVLDPVVLDPNKPRSIAYQLARIETHLAALPKRGDVGRLSPSEQIAPALATQIRTA